jgi:DNA repair protein RadC
MLVQASECLSIPILDHVIVTRKNYYSFREHQLVVKPLPGTGRVQYI